MQAISFFLPPHKLTFVRCSMDPLLTLTRRKGREKKGPSSPFQPREPLRAQAIVSTCAEVLRNNAESIARTRRDAACQQNTAQGFAQEWRALLGFWRRWGGGILLLLLLLLGFFRIIIRRLVCFFVVSVRRRFFASWGNVVTLAGLGPLRR